MLFVIVIYKLGIKTIPIEIINITKILKKEAGLLANNFCCFRSHLKHPFEQCQLNFSLKNFLPLTVPLTIMLNLPVVLFGMLR